MNRLAARGGSGIPAALRTSPLVVALLGLMQGTAAAQSYLAERSAASGDWQCDWEDGPAYTTLDPGNGITAEILSPFRLLRWL